MFHFSYVHFLCLPKENEPKEREAVHLSCFQQDFLRCSQKADASESRTPCGVLRRVVILLFVVLLGCVIWQKTKNYFFYFTPLLKGELQ